MPAFLVQAFQREPVRINTVAELIVMRPKPGELNGVQRNLTSFLDFHINTGPQPTALDGVHFFRRDCCQCIVKDFRERREPWSHAEPQIFSRLFVQYQLAGYPDTRDAQLANPEIAIGQGGQNNIHLVPG